jgi:uncharacterized membrane protein HdeD (DUF308 family)
MIPASFASLFNNLAIHRPQSTLPHYWHLLTLVRWFFTNAILITLKESKVAQIFLLLGISVLFQGLLIIGRPFIEKYDNRMSLLTEVMVSCYLYILLGLTDYQGENLIRDQQGLALVFIIGMTVLVNYLFLGYALLKYLHTIYLKFTNKSIPGIK